MNQPASKPVHCSRESIAVGDSTLDCEHILNYAGGDPELLVQFCGNFLRDAPVHLQSVRSAIKLRNYVVAGVALQHLRNCMVVLGSGQIAFTAEMLEAAVHVRHLREAQQEAKRLERQLQLLIPQVQRLMLDMSMPKTRLQ